MYSKFSFVAMTSSHEAALTGKNLAQSKISEKSYDATKLKTVVMQKRHGKNSFFTFSNIVKFTAPIHSKWYIFKLIYFEAYCHKKSSWYN